MGVIILHQPEDARSRDFVAQCPDDWEVREYPDCVADFPVISAYPTAVVTVPAHYDPILGSNVPAQDVMLRLPLSMGMVTDFINQVDAWAEYYPPVDA